MCKEIRAEMTDIIPLLRHFTVSAEKTRKICHVISVEQGKNMDWKRSDKMAEPNFILFVE